MVCRRQFILQACVGGALLRAGSTLAQDVMLAESAPQAVALAYTADSSKVDKRKFPDYAPKQRCDSCSLFQEKVADVRGACSLFGDKQVSAKGWCSAWGDM
jgi:hypothetical protein